MQKEQVQEKRAQKREMQGVQTQTMTKAGTQAVIILENKTQEAEIREE